MSTKKPYYRKVERILYDYKTYDTAIRNLEAEMESIMPQTSSSVIKMGTDGTRQKAEHSQTETWAIERTEGSRAREIQQKLTEKKRLRDAIRQAKRHFGKLENDFIWLFYDLDKTRRETWEALHVSESSFKRLRDGVVRKVAKWLGLI